MTDAEKRRRAEELREADESIERAAAERAARYLTFAAPWRCAPFSEAALEQALAELGDFSPPPLRRIVVAQWLSPEAIREDAPGVWRIGRVAWERLRAVAVPSSDPTLAYRGVPVVFETVPPPPDSTLSHNLA